MSEKLKNTYKSKNEISLVSLGCPKNLVDSNNLIRKFISNGFLYLNKPEDADILLINTCGFIEDAKRESIEEILKLVETKRASKSQRGEVTVNSDSVTKEKLTLKPDTPKKNLIVFGCLAKRYRDELLKEIPEIDAIFGVGEEDKIVEYCKNLMNGGHGDTETRRNKNLSLPQFTDSPLYQSTHSPIHPFTPSPIHHANSYAYLKIADGCNKKCSYCVIPSIRGNYRSTTPDEILKESERFIKSGVKELILVAQDTACYGKDINGYGLSSLLKDIASISGNFWIRLLYAYPSSINESLLRVIADEDKICKYLDIPFQHSEDRILKLMKRGGSRKGYLSLIKKIHEYIPDIALRTTFIAGFPSETEEEFKHLIDFIEEVRFDRLGVFKYSKEEGTPAAKLKGHIPDAIKNRRTDKIIKHQAYISLQKNKELAGKKFKAIIDEINNGIAIGRLYSHAPEIDGVVIIEAGSKQYEVSSKGRGKQKLPTAHCLLPSIKVGDFVTVEITDAFDYDLKGIVVG